MDHHQHTCGNEVDTALIEKTTGRESAAQINHSDDDAGDEVEGDG
jgi:hypothetical protein